MTLEELKELFELKDWNEAILAGHLHLSEAAVIKWFQRGSVPDGPATVLIKIWLEQARKKKERQPA